MKGKFGERGIEKKVLELPIPKFNPKNKQHMKLAELGQKISKKAQKELEKVLEDYKDKIWKPQHTGRIRGLIRNKFKQELEEIDKITRDLIKRSSFKSKNLMDFMK